MRGFIGNTDQGWYAHLRARPELEEVNFWLPGERQGFRAIQPGEPLFFKLKAPYDAVAGFGQFSRFEWMPVWLAWEVFGEANGVRSAQELLDRLARLHAGKRLTDRIGCVFVAFPVFFAPDDWVERPHDWKRNVVRGSVYELGTGEGRRVWDECTGGRGRDSEVDRRGRGTRPLRRRSPSVRGSASAAFASPSWTPTVGRAP